MGVGRDRGRRPWKAPSRSLVLERGFEQVEGEAEKGGGQGKHPGAMTAGKVAGRGPGNFLCSILWAFPFFVF